MRKEVFPVMLLVSVIGFLLFALVFVENKGLRLKLANCQNNHHKAAESAIGQVVEPIPVVDPDTKYIGKWVGHSGLGDNIVILKSDYTGEAMGSCFPVKCSFKWEVSGNRVLFSEWRGDGYPIIYAEFDSGVTTMMYHKKGTYDTLSKEN